jgi:hypothetical protein
MVYRNASPTATPGSTAGEKSAKPEMNAAAHESAGKIG